MTQRHIAVESVLGYESVGEAHHCANASDVTLGMLGPPLITSVFSWDVVEMCLIRSLSHGGEVAWNAAHEIVIRRFTNDSFLESYVASIADTGCSKNSQWELAEWSSPLLADRRHFLDFVRALDAHDSLVRGVAAVGLATILYKDQPEVRASFITALTGSSGMTRSLGMLLLDINNVKARFAAHSP